MVAPAVGSSRDDGESPQRLKAALSCDAYGTAKAVP
jgi:hypothetical protein